MPRVTRQIEDMKLELESFEFYGFESEKKFNARLHEAILKAKLNMSEFLTLGEINEIEAKEFKSLTREELLIYHAENYFAISEFLEKEARLERQKITVSTQRVSNSIIGKERVSKDYFNDAIRYLNQAGVGTGIYIDFYEDVA